MFAAARWKAVWMAVVLLTLALLPGEGGLTTVSATPLPARTAADTPGLMKRQMNHDHMDHGDQPVPTMPRSDVDHAHSPMHTMPPDHVDHTLMRMYFHFDTHDLLLFARWQTTGPWTFAAALAGTFLLGMGYALFLYQGKPRMVLRHVGEPARLFSALVHTFELSYSLLLMLVVMTFNVGWCVAVVLGVGVGTYVFRRGKHVSLEKDPREVPGGLCC